MVGDGGAHASLQRTRVLPPGLAGMLSAATHSQSPPHPPTHPPTHAPTHPLPPPHTQRPPEITLYRQPAGTVDVRHHIASVPYLRPTSPTWIHQASVRARARHAFIHPCVRACVFLCVCRSPPPPTPTHTLHTHFLHPPTHPLITPQVAVSERYAVVVQNPVFYNIR